jgi:hypothetical protein
VELEILFFNHEKEAFVLVHGGARGADDAARGWYRTRASPVYPDLVQVIFNAEWELHGKAAGMIRNRKMAEAGADLCLAFWDGKSRGTGGMIAVATEHHIPVRIVPL